MGPEPLSPPCFKQFAHGLIKAVPIGTPKFRAIWTLGDVGGGERGACLKQEQETRFSNVEKGLARFSKFQQG